MQALLLDTCDSPAGGPTSAKNLLARSRSGATPFMHSNGRLNACKRSENRSSRRPRGSIVVAALRLGVAGPVASVLGQDWRELLGQWLTRFSSRCSTANNGPKIRADVSATLPKLCHRRPTGRHSERNCAEQCENSFIACELFAAYRSVSARAPAVFGVTLGSEHFLGPTNATPS
jgi:hypothetical protein